MAVVTRDVGVLGDKVCWGPSVLFVCERKF